jgi:23S rRNA pseudouridine2605 synthase
MRLNRFLASAGLGSRRSVEALIREGRVRLNGHVVTDLATTVGPGAVVKVGNRVVHAQHVIHAILHKPRGVVVSADDERGRRTIYELLPREWPRVFHVGRLDKESEGLLIVTNDGDLALKLTHPRYKIDKEYEVTLDKPFDPAHREKLLRGFHIPGGRAKVEALHRTALDTLRLVLRQGIKRQIRLMLYELGYEVETLRRIRIGPIGLGELRPGEWRMLDPREVQALRNDRAAAPRPVGKPAPLSAARRSPRPPVSPGPGRGSAARRG